MLAIGSSLGLSTLARWQSGYAAACKAVYLGSIPGRASSKSSTYSILPSLIFHFLPP